MLELVHYEPAPVEGFDSSQLNIEEKRKRIPQLKTDGNNLYEKKLYGEAARKYGEAVKLLDDLMSKETPDGVEWCTLWDERSPIVLNLAQCNLLLKDYHAVIATMNHFIEKDPSK